MPDSTLRQSPHAALIARLASGAVETALEEALGRLQVGADLPLLIATAEGFGRAGVAGLGVHLLDAVGASATHPEVVRCRAELEAAPTGRVEWDALGARFEDNLAALLETHPALRDDVTTLRAVPGDARLYRTNAGNTHVVRGERAGSLRLLFPIADHVRCARRIELPAPLGNLGFLCLGLPVPPLFEHLRASVDASGYTPPIDIVEMEHAAIGMWLHLVELAAAVRCGRVHLFAGPDAVTHYRSFLRAGVTRHPPTVLIRNQRPGARLPALDRAALDEIGRVKQEQRGELERRQAALYASCDAEYWSRRYAIAPDVDPPLSIVAFTTRFSTYIQHAMRDLAAAFRRRGCRVEVLMESDDATAVVDTWTTLAGTRHDLLVVINHLRFELEGRVHPRVPYVGWIQDRMPALCTPAAGRSITPFDLVLGRNAAEMCARHAYPRDRFLPTPNLTDANLYHPDRVGDDAARFRSDLSYVGHGAGTPEALCEEICRGAPVRYRTVLGAFIEAARARLQTRGDLTYMQQLELLLDAEAAHPGAPFTPAEREQHLLPAAGSLSDRVLRHQSLAWAAEWAEREGRSLRIYGRGWEEHPTLARYSAGAVANGEALRSVYQGTTINFQLNGFTAFHQRLLDAIASGGFVLSRRIGRDFTGPACAVIARAFAGVADLPALLRRRAADPELDAAFTAAESFGLARCAAASDPRRDREGRLMTAVWGRSHRDDELFERLKMITESTDALAGDIPGFADAVFETKTQMFEQLDRFSANDDERAAVAARMRAWVCEHATYDALVERILTTLREGFAGEGRGRTASR